MGGKTARVPGLGGKVVPIRSVPSGAGGATCCESLKQPSEVKTGTKLQAMPPHCCNDSMSPKPHFHFCFTEGNNLFVGNTITTRWRSCRDHPEAPVFCLQKTTVQCSLQRQRKPEVSAPLKTTWRPEMKFPSPRSTACLEFQKNAEHALPRLVLHPPGN